MALAIRTLENTPKLRLAALFANGSRAPPLGLRELQPHLRYAGRLRYFAVWLEN
jgi:hypothetical protein